MVVYDIVRGPHAVDEWNSIQERIKGQPKEDGQSRIKLHRHTHQSMHRICLVRQPRNAHNAPTRDKSRPHINCCRLAPDGANLWVESTATTYYLPLASGALP